MKELAKALIKAQSGMGKLVRDAKNPHFKSDYASLNAVIETAKLELFKAGIAVFEASVIREGQTVQQLVLVHSESGESWESEFPLVCKDPSNPQQLGSAQTYARRYLWTAASGLAPQDDDGNSAAKGEHGLPTQVGTEPSATPPQIKLINGLFKKLDRTDKIAHDLTAFSGRKIDDPKLLTKSEASKLIDRMNKKESA